MYDGFSKLSGFTAIKQDELYVGIEDLILVLLEYAVDLQTVLSVPNAP